MGCENDSNHTRAYCEYCSTCHLCIVEGELYVKKQIEELTKENKRLKEKEFKLGALAMYGWAANAAANHFHGDPTKDKLCDSENGFLMEVMDDAFEYIDPDTLWSIKDINKLSSHKIKLRKALQECFEMLSCTGCPPGVLINAEKALEETKG